MAHKYSSMSRQGVDARRCNKRKVRSLRAGTINLSSSDVAAIEQRANAVTERRRNQQGCKRNVKTLDDDSRSKATAPFQ